MATQMKSKRTRGRPRSTGAQSEPATVQALDRALTVMTGLAHHGRSTLGDISLQMGLPSATAYRILTTLQKHGYADFDSTTQEWMIGIEAYRTGSAFLRRSNLLEISQPFLRALRQSTGETANLAVPLGGEVVFIGQIESENPIRAFFNPGTRTPMHASGTGKAILSVMNRAQVERILKSGGLPEFTPNTITSPSALFDNLDQTQERGYSFDNEERHAGMSCTGAAILDASGKPLAGISVSGPSARFTPENVARFGGNVRDAAREISEVLGYAPPPQ